MSGIELLNLPELYLPELCHFLFCWEFDSRAPGLVLIATRD